MTSDPIRVLDRLLTLDKDELTLGPGLFDLALEHVSSRVEVDLLQIQILHIETEVRYAPGNAVVVTDEDTGQARQRCAFHLERGRLQVDHVPRRREVVHEMRIVGQDGLTGCGPLAGDDPRVRSRRKLLTG